MGTRNENDISRPTRYCYNVRHAKIKLVALTKRWQGTLMATSFAMSGKRAFVQNFWRFVTNYIFGKLSPS